MDYWDSFQSGFSLRYSTDTELVAHVSYLWRAWHGTSAIILVLWDLSAAFSSIDHGIFLDQFQGLGVGSIVLQWLFSFLHGQLQLALVKGKCLSPRPLQCGVPQGLSLLLLLFMTYMKPLGEVIYWYGVWYHQHVMSMLHELHWLPVSFHGAVQGAGHHL